MFVMAMMIIVTITNMMMTEDYRDYDGVIASANNKARTWPIHFLTKKIH
jgi:hypothetical protein